MYMYRPYTTYDPSDFKEVPALSWLSAQGLTIAGALCAKVDLEVALRDSRKFQNFPSLWTQ